MDDGALAIHRSLIIGIVFAIIENVLCILKKTKFHTFPERGRHSWMCQEFLRQDRVAMKT